MQRQFPEPPVPIFSPQGSLLRKVRGNGCIAFNESEIYISEILIGKMVKIEQNKKLLDIYYGKDLIKCVCTHTSLLPASVDSFVTYAT